MRMNCTDPIGRTKPQNEKCCYVTRYVSAVLEAFFKWQSSSFTLTPLIITRKKCQLHNNHAFIPFNNVLVIYSNLPRRNWKYYLSI
jgi:hypothetical protein